MKALVSHNPYDYRYEEVSIPEIGPKEILLKIKGCGICAGDIKAYHGGIRIWGTSKENQYIEPPVIGGHEFCGEVVDMGAEVTGYEIGDMLVTEQIVPCNKCKFCKEGKYWMCERSAVFGFKQYAQGGFAEYVKLSENCINHKVPSTFSLEQAVLIEPIACGMHAVEKGNIQQSDVVVVAGLGAIGLAIVNIARLYIPKLIIGIDLKPNRIKMAREFGADVVLNPLECDVVKEIKHLTDGKGCDLYIEASGNEKSVTQGLESLKNLGKYVQMGVFANLVRTDWNIIGDGKELFIYGSHLSALNYPSVIKGIESGLIKTDGLISHKYKLEHWQEAFEVAEKSEDAVKVMLVP